MPMLCPLNMRMGGSAPCPLQVAKNNEVMVAISNANYAQPGGMLDLWMAGVRRSNVTNALVIALDDATQQHVESLGFTAYQMSLQACSHSLYFLLSYHNLHSLQPSHSPP